MRILVVGAAGRTGRLVVEAALGHGHEVTAMVHEQPLDLAHPRLDKVSGDVLDFEAVERAIDGQDAVAVTLGRRGNTSVHEPAIANIVHAMALHGVGRLAVLSAAGTFARTDSNLSLIYRARIATTARATYDDLEAMERRVMASALDWSIIRPSAMSDEPAQGDYRISLSGTPLAKAGRIPRGDVAAVILKSLESNAYLKRTVALAG